MNERIGDGDAPEASSAGASPYPVARRTQPARGVHLFSGEQTIVFVTVCTARREQWLGCDEAHQMLREVWAASTAWMVGEYVVMPDHLHLFAAVRDREMPIERWLQYWKSQFTKQHENEGWNWQAYAFHHRLRNRDEYLNKLDYMRLNPVRPELVEDATQWKFKGLIHEIEWRSW